MDSRSEHGSFSGNRRRLSASLPPGSLAVIATGPHPLPCGVDSAKPWPDFHYLTGLREPQSGLILEAHPAGEGRAVLFAPPHDHLWDGPTVECDIADVRPWTEFETVLRAMAFQTPVLLVHSPENPFAPQEDHWLAHLCRRLLPLHALERLAPFLGRLRAEKSPAEIAHLREAHALAARAFRRAIGFVRPGVRGFEVKAEFLHEITRHGSAGLCCPPITAAGAEVLALHWPGDRRPWNGDEMALLDFTVEWNGLCADMARCAPVGGRFSPRHRAVYDAVLRVLREATGLLRPGRLLDECQQEVELLLQHELLRMGLLKSSDVKDPASPSPALHSFFMHEAFHHIGIEVHDPVPASLPLAPGHVLAVEPALYVAAEGFGIRLENNVLITETGAENLSAALPVEAEEIEGLLHL
ncbi:MAG TPA: Xaa-Pro aminopeptidase [Verrucomicrobiales bacterium]|nr:Xaa-Pro aminopeptidase [Verrucomicrobiales bacterium]